MEKLKQIRKLRKGWKIFIAAMLALIVFGGVGMYVAASSNVKITMSVGGLTVYKGKTSKTLYASLSGTDENAQESVPVPERLEWSTSNSQIADFATGTEDNPVYMDSVTGLTPVIHGNFAGKATITANYYTKKFDEDNNEIVGSRELLDTRKATVTVPLSVTVTYNGSESIPNYLEVGSQLYITTNASDANRIVIETSNDKTGTVSSDGVVKLVQSTGSTATLEVVGGGTTTVYVRTTDNPEKEDALVKIFKVTGKIHFLDGQGNANAQNHFIQTSSTTPSNGVKRYMVLDTTEYKDFMQEEVPSNIMYPATSGVTFRSDDKDVCTYTAGSLLGVHAGVSRVSAGIYSQDTLGNEVALTKDEINVVVPFKKMGNNVTNLNVGDQIQLTTTAKPSEVTWSTTSNSVLQVDATTGLVTAMGAGKATIIATRTQDELYTVYGLPYQLKYDFVVIDGFGLSTTSATVNIGDSFDLTALVTDEDLKKSPVTFKVENQPGADGITPTGTLVTTTQNGKVLTVKGVASGTVKITATQTINGVMKSESCVVYVTTPVGEITINPSSVTVDRGSTTTVQLLFNPAGPTNNKVLWGTSNPDVATVEGDSYTATITGVKGGTATINVISEDGLKVATCDVYVREPVTGITLNETTVESSMAIGKFQLVATVNPAGEGVNRNVTWTSSDTSIITVDENGLVSFVKPGYATIVCKTEDGAFIATCNFIISIPVTSIKLDYTDEIMSLGQRLRITAEVLPVDASNKNVYWESSNTNVCIVDSNGLVEAVGTGSCTILCKSVDGGSTAMCNIYVKQPVTQIVLNTTDITVRKGQVFWLNATCLPENADNKIVTWESRDESVCKVENDGKCTATGAGTTSIIATNVDTGLTAYCVVTVTQPVTGITLNSDYQLMWVGSKYAIIPTIEPADAENKNVTYFSSDSTVATVDEHGVVTALKGGTCVIEVTTEECQLTAACTIEVKEYVSSVTLSEHNKFLNVGASGTLTASVETSTATNKNIVWSSSNNDICSVDQKGNIIGYNPGTAVITATAADGSGVSDSCIVRVVNPVTSISVEPSTVHLLVGDSTIVTANIYPEDASVKDVDWTSSNEAIAVVDEAGEIFALSTGKCKVTATSKDGNDIKGVCWVYVTPVVNISSIKINSSEIYMLTGKSRQLTVRVRPATNTDSYGWYSTDTGIVTVNDDGVITTVGPGTADVVCESTANGVSSTCTVHAVGLSRSYITLEQYDSYWLDVIGTDTDDRIVWRSSNPRVCTISSSGQVIARKAGTTTVTAVTHNKTMTCTVRVTNIPK